MLSSKELNRFCTPTGKKIGIELKEVSSKDEYIFQVIPAGSDTNNCQTVHGGYLYTIADEACAQALYLMLNHTKGYTTRGEILFERPVLAGKTLNVSVTFISFNKDGNSGTRKSTLEANIYMAIQRGQKKIASVITEWLHKEPRPID